MAHILPPPPDAENPPPHSRLDGCLEACGNTETPYRVDGTTAFYCCADCGAAWFTNWGEC